MGELALDGTLRPIKRCFAHCHRSKKGMVSKALFFQKENAAEAAIVNNLDVIGVENLNEAIWVLEGTSDIKPVEMDYS